MKEYIERASVHSIIERTSTFAFTRGGMHEKIDSLPAADVAPVRHAAKAESAISKTGLMCTACYSDIDADAVYCKYCGALMDGEKADNA